VTAVTLEKLGEKKAISTYIVALGSLLSYSVFSSIACKLSIITCLEYRPHAPLFCGVQ
jgi:hypothetical protein